MYKKNIDIVKVNINPFSFNVYTKIENMWKISRGAPSNELKRTWSEIVKRETIVYEQ